VEGMSSDGIEDVLRDLMHQSKAPTDARWHARYNDIPRTAESAEAKYGKYAPVLDWSSRIGPALRELVARQAGEKSGKKSGFFGKRPRRKRLKGLSPYSMRKAFKAAFASLRKEAGR